MSENNALYEFEECPAISPACQVGQVGDADYVNTFIGYLADPEIRVITVKPHDWTCHGANAKAAILAALTASVQLAADRDSWKKGCENWFASAKAIGEANDEHKRELDSARHDLHKLRGEFEACRQSAIMEANGLVQSYDAACLIVAISVAVNILLGASLFWRYFW